MHLPISIDNLLNTNIVESDRIEFKAGWNPQAILKSICAFANDFQNFGGGYIIVGVEESNGVPILPPIGLDSSTLDKTQKDLVNACYHIKPTYTPITCIETYEEKTLFVIWCPGGGNRPYSGPKTLGKEKEYSYFIRKGSSTVVAKNDELKELLAFTTIPFDDRVNHQSSVEDIKLPLIQSFLKRVNSGLLEDSKSVAFKDLCHQMAIINGGGENLKPRNVGLLFFNDSPEFYFPYAQIEVVYFPDGEAGDRIEEKIFKGPIEQQLQDALRYIQNNFILERVTKLPNKAKAERLFNYPFVAIEEALVNAVYHRSYEVREPIEVRINPDSIRIVSHPGVDASISLNQVEDGKMITRRYRNRRIGEFLKELDFTEGRGTGIPKIKRVMHDNGSPEPIFHTDEARTFFYTEIQLHPDFLKIENSGVHEGVHEGVYD